MHFLNIDIFTMPSFDKSFALALNSFYQFVLFSIAQFFGSWLHKIAEKNGNSTIRFKPEIVPTIEIIFDFLCPVNYHSIHLLRLCVWRTTDQTTWLISVCMHFCFVCLYRYSFSRCKEMLNRLCVLDTRWALERMPICVSCSTCTSILSVCARPAISQIRRGINM